MLGSCILVSQAVLDKCEQPEHFHTQKMGSCVLKGKSQGVVVYEVLELTRAFDAEEKIIGMICHAGWIPISAGVMKGRKVTSTPGIRDDLVNAGATWVDEAVVQDGHWISARRPPDLPAFGGALVDYLQSNPPSI